MITRWRAAVLAAPIALATAPAWGAPTDAVAAFDAVRQQSVAAAQAEQQQEAAVGALQHQIALLAADIAGRQRDIDDSRPQQANLLAALAFLARHRDRPAAAAAESPLDRQRGALLISAAAPELRAEAHALMAEIGDIARLRQETAARRRELADAAAAVAQERGRVVQLVTRRLALTARLLPQAADPAALLRMAARAKNVGDLIALADAATERRDRILAARHIADPTRPAAPGAFDPPHSALRLPISGTINRRFGEPDAAGVASQGLGLDAALAGAEVVAPCGGQVVYAGAFRDLGLLLIIRCGGLYHSVLAGFGRIDVVADAWLVAGEPVGTLPDAPAASVAEGAGAPLYFEVRRGSQPVDPQPWLATQAAGRDAANGEQKVGR